MIDKLVLVHENEILNALPLNTTNTISVNDRNDRICIILLIIMRLIMHHNLAVISVSCYYITRDIG